MARRENAGVSTAAGLGTSVRLDPGTAYALYVTNSRTVTVVRTWRPEVDEASI